LFILVAVPETPETPETLGNSGGSPGNSGNSVHVARLHFDAIGVGGAFHLLRKGGTAELIVERDAGEGTISERGLIPLNRYRLRRIVVKG
jgi:hypothetical protein